MSASIIERVLQQEVCELILNRPHKLNALDGGMISGLSQKLSQIAQQQTLRVLILSANGKWFCAGADLQWMTASTADHGNDPALSDGTKSQQHEDGPMQLANLFRQLNTLPVFTIAKVSGGAMGGGLGLLSCCDMVIANADCQFSFSELKLGLLPATILPYVLAAIGARQARRFILSTEQFSSQSAKEIGLVHQIVKPEQLHNTVLKQVENVLKTAPQTLRQCKALIQKSSIADDQALIHESARVLASARNTAEAREGIRAFFNKSPPSWVGSVKQHHYPHTVQIVEVGPRDGLQSEQKILSTVDKVTLINDLSDCGYSAIEVSSFVKADKIPQLADAEQVFLGITPAKECVYSAVVANKKGLDRALSCSLKQIALLTAASETFCNKNINCTVEQSMAQIESIVSGARKARMRIRVYISCAFDCPYEGLTNPDKVGALIQKLEAIDVDEITLADTTGKATSAQVENLIQLSLQYTAVERLSMHFHDSYGQALANVLISLQLGVTRFDSSIAGIGGCNFCPGASGNLASEDLLFMLNGLGISTGIDLEKLVRVGSRLSTLLGHHNDSRVGNQLARQRNEVD